MARKKIVLVLVEGPSDDVALGVFLHRLFDKNTVHIEILHGDITSNLDIAPENIVKALGNTVKSFAASMRFTKNHFQEVIHLIDMDGAYIPDEAVIYNAEAEKPIYSLTSIQTVRPERIIERNLHKQKKLNRISGLRTVWQTIPYHAYYMSSNLDHVLYDKQNSTDEEKEIDALNFARKYKDNIDGFLTFISDSDFSRMEGYQESWKFIQKECHSLERHTNFGLCFAEIRSERKDKK